MTNINVTFLCCVLVISFGITYAAIPEYIHVCHRSDPQVSRCIQNSVEALRPQLVKGIPELGVPGIDPFHISKIVIFDPADNPNLDVSISNIDSRGAGNFEILKLKTDVEQMTYRVAVRIPVLDLTGEFNVNVQIVASPMAGKGKFSANATDIEGHVLIQGEVVDNHMYFKSIDFKINIGDFNINIGNFGSDPTLSALVNQLLNTNKPEMIRLAIPFIERGASERFLALSNQITKNFDYDEVFPL